MGERSAERQALEQVLRFLLHPGSVAAQDVHRALADALGADHPLLLRWRARPPAPDGAETVAFARAVTDDEVANLNQTARRAFHDWAARRDAMSAAAAARQARG
jgi:hypothetical protein